MSLEKAPTAAEIQEALVIHLRHKNTLLVPNVYVLGSPWESDLIAISPKCYWTEYEIKLSVADYRNDFQKKRFCTPDSQRKHDFYKSTEDAAKRWGRVVPKPRRFYFVVPAGLLDNVDVPEHCGLIEFNPEAYRFHRITESRKAPQLKKPTQLSHEVMYNMAVKLSSKLAWQSVS